MFNNKKQLTMKKILIPLVILVLVAVACTTPAPKTQEITEPSVPIYTGEAVVHEFAALPYSYDALEPYIDAQTMEIHYSRHHQAYFNNFLKAIEGSGYEQASLEFFFDNISYFSAAIRNNAGGYFNHSLFWSLMAPAGTGGAPSDALAQAINAKFGSLENFQTEFNAAATGRFGSGWAWLIVTEDGSLTITSTANQDNPLMETEAVQGKPLLALDVWEHAYYLKYQNKRADYVANFWNVVNWNKVNELYEATLN